MATQSNSELQGTHEEIKSLPAVPSKRVPKYMKAFDFAFDAGYMKGYDRGKFEANQRRKK